MFGRSFFGGRWYGPRYWGDGGTATPEPPIPEPRTPVLAGAAIRAYIRPSEQPEVVHTRIHISGGGQIKIIGHKSVEYPPDDEVLQFLGMV